MTDRLVLEEGKDGHLRVSFQRGGMSVAEAQTEITFASPLDAAVLEDLRWYLEDYLIAPYAVYEARGQAIADRLDALGERLFAAVFSDQGARDAYTAAMQSGNGARIALSGHTPSFLGLPWELMKDPGRPDPLALRLAAFDRLAASPVAPAEVPPGDTLRVLMVIARPEGLSDVGFQMVARPLMERLEAVRGRVEFEVLRPPSFEAMARRLLDQAGTGLPFHILHFDGHGTFGTGVVSGFSSAQFKGPQGCLAFEQPAGGTERVLAEDFAQVVAQAKVPVVVLNACRSATVSHGAVGRGSEGASVEAAVATRLLATGAASVVAMGYSVYAVAAAEFMAAFYEALFDGSTVAAAVATGRRRLKTRAERPSPKGPLPLRDWIVPVHYTRREVAFPRLKQTRLKDVPDLDAMLDALAGDAAGPAQDPLAPDRRFVGRDRAFYALELAMRTDRVALLRGTAGTGKTELAKAFGRWWRDTGGAELPEWVVFHSAAPGTANPGLDAAVTAVGLAVFGPNFVLKAVTSAQRERLALQLLRERRVLLIWDNFESLRSIPEGAAGPLPEAECERLRAFLAAVRAPGGCGGAVLTSRAPEEWLGSELRRLDVGGLEPEEANQLATDLLAGLPRARERRKHRSFAKLLEWLEGHPLSLRVLLPKLEEIEPTALLAALEGATAALPPGFEGQERTRHLGASLALSFDQLTEMERNLALVLALFEGTADQNILALFSEEPGVPARFAQVNEAGWASLLDRLASVGLVTRQDICMAGLHPALPVWLSSVWNATAGESFASERVAAEGSLRLAYAVFGAWLMSEIESGKVELAFALLTQQRRTLSRLLHSALAEGAWEEVLRMLMPLNTFLEARGLYSEASAWAKAARSAVEKVSDHKSGFANAAGALWLYAEGFEAGLALAAGDLTAAERAYNAIRQQLETGDAGRGSLELAITYHQLGIVAQKCNNPDAAEAWYRRSLEINEALGNQPGMAATYGQLGIMAQESGDLDAAETQHRRSLQISEARGNRPSMALSYQALGTVAQIRGNLDAAEEWHHRSLKIYEALSDQRGMAPSYHQLGMVAQDRGDLDTAEAWYRRSLGICDVLNDQPGMAASCHQLGILTQIRGNRDTAEAWYHRSLEIKEALGDQRGMAPTYHQLGMVAQDRGDLDKAETWYRRSLEIKEAVADRSSRALTYGQMGLLAATQGKEMAALEWMVRCVSLFSEFPHSSTGPAPRHLRNLTRALGIAALEATWQRVTNVALPPKIRASVADAA